MEKHESGKTRNKKEKKILWNNFIGEQKNYSMNCRNIYKLMKQLKMHNILF